MVNPVPGYRVSTGYGVPGNWAAGKHTGDDYAAPFGTVVVAAAGGRVIGNAFDRSYGNYVELQTGNARHRYCHLDRRPNLAIGSLVTAGQQVGQVGSTGNSTGPHLHYEERTPPYGYHNHRRPVFNHQSASDQEDDVAAKDVWEYPVDDDFGGEYSAETYLRRIPRVADEVISKRLRLPDGSEADLWAVLVDTLTRIKRIEDKLDG